MTSFEFAYYPAKPLHTGYTFFIQPKQAGNLSINQPNDPYEQEADAIDDRVMRMEDTGIQLKSLATLSIQRKCSGCAAEEKEKLQRKEVNDSESTTDTSIENYVGGLSGSGKSLPEQVRHFYEPRFGHDFSNVRVHTDSEAAKSAQSINAFAYTSGNNIVFNQNQYSPETFNGKRLLAHELVHTIHQGKVKNNRIQRVSFGNDGLLSPERQQKVLLAAKIADRLTSTREFATKWQAFISTFSKAQDISHFPSLEDYRTALNNRIVHDMDSTKDARIREFVVTEEKSLPLERQTGAVTVLNTQNTYMRQFTIDQGIDSIVSLLLHESMHGAGIPMGPLEMYEPAMHQFEAKAGFPMMMGGADILKIEQKRVGDYHVDVTITYQLRNVSKDEPLPSNIEIQIVYPENGQIVQDEGPKGEKLPAKKALPSRTAKGTWVWHAKYPGFSDYHVRIVNEDTTLRASERFSANPRCVLGVSSVHCED